MAPEESPFGASVLDCRPITQNLTSTTPDIGIAEYFASSRASSGDQLDGIQLPNVLVTPAGLRYPYRGPERPDGAVFLARVMEEKWDLYIWRRRLFCLRSWTGRPEYAAQFTWTSGEWTVVEVSRAQEIEEDPSRSIQVVDYLIKSHLYNLVAPHPLQPAHKGDDQALALGSFQEFGCRALYGTFENLVHSESVAKALWGEQPG